MTIPQTHDSDHAPDYWGSTDEPLTPRQRRARIDQLTARVQGLGGDARYWDVRRTYGDYSEELLRYLECRSSE